MLIIKTRMVRELTNTPHTSALSTKPQCDTTSCFSSSIFFDFPSVLWSCFVISPETSQASPDFPSPQQLSAEHAQVSQVLTSEVHGGFFSSRTFVATFVELSVSITSPNTDHLPTDVILAIAEVPRILSGPFTKTCMYPLVCPTYKFSLSIRMNLIL